MEPIRYKRLFEVRILHEYYLIGTDRTSFFDLAGNPAQYNTLLRDRINDGYTLMSDLQVEPTEKTKKQLQQYGLKYSLTYTGFIVGSGVKAIPQTDGSINYQPQPKLPPELTLEFWITTPRSDFKSFSNIGLRRGLPAVYLLDNQPVGKTFDPTIEPFPKLSRPVASYNAATRYQMSDLAAFDESGTRALKMAMRMMDDSASSSEPANWTTGFPPNAYLNENDRRLLPNRFAYTFPVSQTRYEAILQTVDGAEVKRIAQTTTKPQFKQVALNFAEKDLLPDQEKAEPIPAGEYRLIISGDSDYLPENRLVSLRGERQTSALALISIQVGVGDPTYNVLTADGLLRTRRLSNGTRTNPAVYEIWIKSRLAYWRYRAKVKPLKLDTAPALTTYLAEVAPNLETLRPYLLSSRQTVFREGATDVFLPQPRPSPIREEANRHVVEVYATEVKENSNTIIV